MRTLLLSVTLLGSLAWAMPAPAQMSEIVVTAQRVSGDDYSSIPAVVLEHRADFLAQRIRLTNDTRDKTARAKELHQTVHDMLADAGKRPGIALSYGEEFLIPIQPDTPELPLRDGTARADTSSADLYVKMALGEKDDVQKAIKELNTFIKKARVSGRTEIEPAGDVGLSIVTPEKYRYDIIARIVADAKHLQDTMHGQCKVEIAGLSNRVSWQRTDVSELTLYIPYQIQLTDCQ